MADARLAAVTAAAASEFAIVIGGIVVVVVVAVVVGVRIAVCRHGGRGRVAIQHLEDDKRKHGEKVDVLRAWTR